MKLAILACLLAVVVARPQNVLLPPELLPLDNPVIAPDSSISDANRLRDRQAQILTYTNVNTEDGGNRNSFTADNGIQREETITLKEVQVTDDDGVVTTKIIPVYEGSYQYLRDDGSLAISRYYTDETGFHVESDDLPVAPEAVQI